MLIFVYMYNGKADVMTEFTLDEAHEFLEQNLDNAIKSIERIQKDLVLQKEQATIHQVSKFYIYCNG